MKQKDWRRAAAVYALAALIGAPWAAHAVPDVLVRPAMTSPRVAHAVMLDIARAGERLVAVGERGTVALSDDGGVSWRQAAVPVSVSLTNVAFVDGTHGWAVGHGGVVIHSADGGASWAVQLDGRKAAELSLGAARRMHGESAQHFVADGERLVQDGPDKPLLDVHFLDERHGFVIGAYGLALETQDGGATWTPLLERLPNPGGMHLYGMQSIGGRLWVVGEQGAIFVSDNRGRDFRRIDSPYAGSYFGVVGGAAGEIIVFGMRGNVYRSVDGGGTWEKSGFDGGNALTAGLLADGSVLLTDAGGELHRSEDGARTSTRVPVPKLAPLTGIARAADGAWTVSGVRGVARLAPKQ